MAGVRNQGDLTMPVGLHWVPALAEESECVVRRHLAQPVVCTASDAPHPTSPDGLGIHTQHPIQNSLCLQIMRTRP